MVTQTRNPTGDGTFSGTWTGSAGSRWTLVDDYPDSSGTDVLTVSSGSASTPAVGLYTFSAFTVPAGSTSVGFLVRATARRNGGGSATINARIVFNNGNVRDGTAATPGNGSLTTHTWNWGTGNPSSGTGWTVDEINGVGPHGIASWGIICNDANPTISISALQAEASYTEPSVTGTFGGIPLANTDCLAEGKVINVGTFSSTLTEGVSAAFSGTVTEVTRRGFYSPIFLEMGGAGSVGDPPNGTIASTLAGVTSSFSGQAGITGTITSTLGGITSTFSGVVAGTMGYYSPLWLEMGGAGASIAPTGTLNSTLDGVSASFSGILHATGSVFSVLGGVSSSFSGFTGAVFGAYRSLLWLEMGGAGAVPLEPKIIYPYDDGVPVGWYSDPGYATYYSFDPPGIRVQNRDNTGSVSGEFSSTLDNITSAFSGLVVENATGTVSATLAGITAAFDGNTGNPTGTISSTLQGLFCDFTLSVADVGPFESLLAGVTGSLAGTVTNVGTLAPTLQGVFAAFEGGANPHVTGTIGSTLEGVFSASGKLPYTGLGIHIGIGMGHWQ